MLTIDQARIIMSQCIEIARKNQTPFGAALVDDEGTILQLAANTSKINGPLAHAEMNVLQALHKYTRHPIHLVTTCEPCPMCAGAAVWSGVRSIHFGVSIRQAKEYLKQIDVKTDQIIEASWENIPLYSGLMEKECLLLFE